MRQLRITTSITNRDTLSVDKYLHEIGKIRLLTREEEVELTMRIFKESKKEDVDKLVRANLRFVVSVAKQYHSPGLPLIDLINEGNIGLIQCVDKYDPTKGFKFISYAVWWIRQAITIYLYQKARIVKIPQNKITQIGRIDRAYSKLEQQNHYAPDVNQLHEELGGELSVDDISDLLSFKERVKSLDEPFTSDATESRADYLMDDDTEEKMHFDESTQLIKIAKSVLKEREFIIFEMFYGFDNGKAKNMEEIGRKFDMTRERIRQIMFMVHRKLSTPRIKRLILKTIV